MMSQNIKDEFIYVSVRENVKLNQDNVKLKYIYEFKSRTTNITLFSEVSGTILVLFVVLEIVPEIVPK